MNDETKIHIWGKEFDKDGLIGTVYRIQRQTNMSPCYYTFWKPNDWLQLKIAYSPHKTIAEEKLKVRIGLVYSEETGSLIGEYRLDHKSFQQDSNVVFGLFEKMKEHLSLELNYLTTPKHWVYMTQTTDAFSSAIDLLCCRPDQNNSQISDREINVLFQYIFKNHTRAVKDSKTNMQKFHSGALVFRENGKIKYVPEHFTLKDLSQFLLACGKLPGSKDIKTFSGKDLARGLTHERS